jgi:hypothetical protein
MFEPVENGFDFIGVLCFLSFLRRGEPQAQFAPAVRPARNERRRSFH